MEIHVNTYVYLDIICIPRERERERERKACVSAVQPVGTLHHPAMLSRDSAALDVQTKHVINLIADQTFLLGVPLNPTLLF